MCSYRNGTVHHKIKNPLVNFFYIWYNIFIYTDGTG